MSEEKEYLQRAPQIQRSTWSKSSPDMNLRGTHQGGIGGRQFQ